MPNNNGLLDINEAIELTEKKIILKSTAIFERITYAIGEAAERGKYETFIALTPEEEPFGEYVVNTLINQGYKAELKQAVDQRDQDTIHFSWKS